jgi:hypothetical protein
MRGLELFNGETRAGVRAWFLDRDDRPLGRFQF